MKRNQGVNLKRTEGVNMGVFSNPRMKPGKNHIEEIYRELKTNDPHVLILDLAWNDDESKYFSDYIDLADSEDNETVRQKISTSKPQVFELIDKIIEYDPVDDTIYFFPIIILTLFKKSIETLFKNIYGFRPDFLIVQKPPIQNSNEILKPLIEKCINAKLFYYTIREKEKNKPVFVPTKTLISIFDDVMKVYDKDVSVFLYGKTGTGKQVIAEAIHMLSKRAGKRTGWQQRNLTEIPEPLLSAFLFGVKKGAFTGAIEQPGIFEDACRYNNKECKGTVFLDQIEQLSKAQQHSLLRVIEEKTVTRMGSNEVINVDVRIIAGSELSLIQLREGHFDEALLQRLAVYPIVIPPLNERIMEIESLIKTFYEYFCGKYGMPTRSLDENDILPFQKFHYIGNIRQIKNLIDRAVINGFKPLSNVLIDEEQTSSLSETEKKATNDLKQNIFQRLWELCEFSNLNLNDLKTEIDGYFIETAKGITKNKTEAARKLGLLSAAGKADTMDNRWKLFEIYRKEKLKNENQYN